METQPTVTIVDLDGLESAAEEFIAGSSDW